MNDVLKYLQNKIRDEIQVVTDNISDGSAKDFGEYRYQCGAIRGLLISARIVAETIDRLEELDE
jgi:hypothetical protein